MPAWPSAMPRRSPFRKCKTGPKIIRPAVMMPIRFALSLRSVEDLLDKRRIGICQETVRFGWQRFGPMFAAEVGKRRIAGMKSSRWRWHLDEMSVTDLPRWYGAALKETCAAHRQETGRWSNNRAENSRLPLRRRERAMFRFRRMRTLETFAAVRASLHNHFNQERRLQNRDHDKQTRPAARAERRGLLAT